MDYTWVMYGLQPTQLKRDMRMLALLRPQRSRSPSGPLCFWDRRWKNISWWQARVHLVS